MAFDNVVQSHPEILFKACLLVDCGEVLNRDGVSLRKMKDQVLQRLKRQLNFFWLDAEPLSERLNWD